MGVLASQQLEVMIKHSKISQRKDQSLKNFNKTRGEEQNGPEKNRQRLRNRS